MAYQNTNDQPYFQVHQLCTKIRNDRKSGINGLFQTVKEL